ncbi:MULTISPECIES: DUF6427 family protein [Polaribacter]|uniref:DUF6427 family protein n=1 Tax=Polaribacter sejongensis TaxID=985043 RepID=A0AAJ1QU60_9FLAO|nr:MULTISPECIES: DUF6427 family protein [Polaribacter]MDN3618077.1 DUF6427 family protein [Polaribacter undariae]UWD30930.1 DUF6427 family protein [Polaribacter undariae]
MLANFLEKSKPINFIVYFGLFFCFFIITVFSNLLTDNFTWLKTMENISFLGLFLIVFFFYNFIVSKNKLTFDHSYAFFIFILTSILFTPKLLGLKALLTLIIYLLFLRKIYSLRSPKKVIQKLFDSGFWLGILFIIEPLTLIFLILIYASILLRKKVSFHTLLTPIIGFISPLIIYFAYLFWYDSSEEFQQLFTFNTINNVFIYKKDSTLWIFGTILLLTVSSIFLKSPKALSVNNSFKKSWIVLIINSIIAVAFALVITEKSGAEIVYFLIPASVIIANGFEVIEKMIVKNILSGLLLIGTVITYFLL